MPPGLYPDEATNGNDAINAIEQGWSWFYDNNGGREGLFINLQALALWIVGLHEPWVLRIVAAICGILTIPGIYLLGKELWNRRVGLVTAALLAGSFWHLVFSRIGFRAIMVPLILTWSLYVLLVGVRRIRAHQQYGWALTALGGALAGLGLHTYISFRISVLTFAVVGLALIWKAQDARKRIFGGLVLAGVSALIVAAPLLHYFATHPGSFSGRSEQVSVFNSERPLYDIGNNIARTAGMLVMQGDGNWRHNDSGEPQVPLLVFVFVIGGFAYAGKRLMDTRGRDIPGITIMVLLITGAAPAVISNEGIPHALRSIALIVPVFLLAGLGLERLWVHLEKKGLGSIGAVIALVVCVYGFWLTTTSYALYARKPEVRAEFTKEYLEIGRQLLRRDLSLPAYVIVPQGDVLIDGIPVAAQTPMFISNTATRGQQERGRVYYVTDPSQIPSNVAVYDMRK